VTVEELRWPASNDAVKGRNSLLPIQQQLHRPRRQLPITASIGLLGLSLPDQEASNRVSPVERIHQILHLRTAPNIAPLELRQSDAAEINLVKDGLNLHCWVTFRRGSARERVSMLAGNERRNEGAPAQSINQAVASHSDRGERAHYTPQRPSLPQPLMGRVTPLPARAFARVTGPKLRQMYRNPVPWPSDSRRRHLCPVRCDRRGPLPDPPSLDSNGGHSGVRDSHLSRSVTRRRRAAS